jgi:hypothetical protein
MRREGDVRTLASIEREALRRRAARCRSRRKVSDQGGRTDFGDGFFNLLNTAPGKSFLATSFAASFKGNSLGSFSAARVRRTRMGGERLGGARTTATGEGESTQRRVRGKGSSHPTSKTRRVCPVDCMPCQHEMPEHATMPRRRTTATHARTTTGRAGCCCVEIATTVMGGVCDVEHVLCCGLACGLTRGWVYSLPLLASECSEGGCDGVSLRTGLVGLSMSLKASAFARARQKKTWVAVCETTIKVGD